MAIFRNRFTSIEDIVLVFAACAVPLEFPGCGRYFCLHTDSRLESAMVLLVLILLGAILPARLSRDEFVAQGSILVLLTLGWAIAARYTRIFPFTIFA